MQRSQFNQTPAPVCLVPDPVTGVYSYGIKSGLITGVATTADLFYLQNGESNYELAVRRLALGFITTTAFGAAQMVDFGVSICRTWTTYSNSSGTAISTAGSFNQRATPMDPTTIVNIAVCDTGAMGAGTKTLDGTPVANIAGWSSAIGNTIPLTELLNIEAGEQPIVLRQDEGLTIRPLTAFGATGVGRLYINLEFTHVPKGSYS